jgi:hypothetical protein
MNNFIDDSEYSNTVGGLVNKVKSKIEEAKKNTTTVKSKLAQKAAEFKNKTATQEPVTEQVTDDLVIPDEPVPFYKNKKVLIIGGFSLLIITWLTIWLIKRRKK